MSNEFAVHFIIRKGLGPDHFEKTVFVCVDDIDPEMSEADIKYMAVTEAERELRNTEDYPIYGKNWVFKSIEAT